jgi:ubiquinone/menaquinone biosynthesis C-methylase UbiE
VNLDDKTKPDIFHDLEEPLPVASASYDHVLLINVLEHVFNYRQLLAEAARAVKPGGTVVIIVPFLFPIHPSPSDYWRFTAETLRKECALAGLTIDTLAPLGGGVFSARYLLLDRLMPGLVRACVFWYDQHVIRAGDAIFTRFARLLGKKYDPADYALGYAVIAHR